MTGEGDGLVVLPTESLARHTAWRTGGLCDAFVWVHDPDALNRVISDCREVGWKWRMLGAGTRIVVRDGGITGVVIRLGTGFSKIERSADTWEVGAAVPVPAVVAEARARGLTGLEALANVPGSVGASVHLDEGWDEVVEEVHYLHRGSIRSAPLDEVQGRNRIVTGCRIRLEPGQDKAMDTAIRRALDARRALPPSSWYHLPKRGKLRDLLGSVELPDVRLRRVAIPAGAPELLVNLGEGTAADLDLLHRSATDRVKKTRGAHLDSRIRWVGNRLAT